MYASFQTFAKAIFQKLTGEENASLHLSFEDSFFTRFNEAKIRQTIKVLQGEITLTLVKNNRNSFFTFPFGMDQEKNIEQGLNALTHCRKECEALSADPFWISLGNSGNSHEVHAGNFPKDGAWFDEIGPRIHGLDCAGFLTAGKMIRANLNSLGQDHWYEGDSFFFDCSLYTTNQQAVKLFYGDKVWSTTVFEEKLNHAVEQLSRLQKAKRIISPGKYRTYFAPDAVSELIGIFSWNGVSASAYHQGQCALKPLADGQTKFSPFFSLTEDFTLGFSPRFNGLGELSPVSLPIIEKGELKNMLVSSKTAKEYKLKANYAEEGERLRSASVATGTLEDKEILKRLDTGLYVSNLHYLNWSDLNKGRITGMTRYACFWAEDGKLVSPIQDLRFDESIYHLFGQGLLGLTSNVHSILETSTYEQRSIGGKRVPGILVDNCTYTL